MKFRKDPFNNPEIVIGKLILTFTKKLPKYKEVWYKKYFYTGKNPQSYYGRIMWLTWFYDKKSLYI